MLSSLRVLAPSRFIGGRSRHLLRSPACAVLLVLRSHVSFRCVAAAADETLNPFRCCGVAPGSLASGLLWSILMTVTVSTVEFFTGGFMTLGMGSCMDDLFHSGRLNDGASLNHAHWGEPSLHGNLAMFFVSSFAFSAAAIALPIPSGCVMPTFVVGAGLGAFSANCLISITRRVNTILVSPGWIRCGRRCCVLCRGYTNYY